MAIRLEYKGNNSEKNDDRVFAVTEFEDGKDLSPDYYFCNGDDGANMILDIYPDKSGVKIPPALITYHKLPAKDTPYDFTVDPLFQTSSDGLKRWRVFEENTFYFTGWYDYANDGYYEIEVTGKDAYMEKLIGRPFTAITPTYFYDRGFQYTATADLAVSKRSGKYYVTISNITTAGAINWVDNSQSINLYYDVFVVTFSGLDYTFINQDNKSKQITVFEGYNLDDGGYNLSFKGGDTWISLDGQRYGALTKPPLADNQSLPTGVFVSNNMFIFQAAPMTSPEGMYPIGINQSGSAPATKDYVFYQQSGWQTKAGNIYSSMFRLIGDTLSFALWVKNASWTANNYEVGYISKWAPSQNSDATVPLTSTFISAINSTKTYTAVMSATYNWNATSKVGYISLIGDTVDGKDLCIATYSGQNSYNFIFCNFVKRAANVVLTRASDKANILVGDDDA